MYHAHFRGTHYEAGLQWGSSLAKRQNFILENIPFPITQERFAFASACLPIYETYYPEIIEEIRGLSEGQHCGERILQAVLFSMYAIPPACNCSCFAVADGQNILLGRNSDFLPELEKLNLNVIYKLTDGAYSFTGNTTAFVEIEDGVNLHGLAIGLTSVYPRSRKPGFNAGLLLRYLLEKCKTTSEAIGCLHRLPIASAQTFTLADAAGEIAVVECSGERVECVKPSSETRPFVCATNTFHLPNLPVYHSGGIDDWFSETRYQTLVSALSRHGESFDLTFAKKLLSGEYGFLCQYDRSTGRDTVWSTIYDLKQHRIYRSEGNPMRRGFREDLRFRYSR